MGDRADGPRSSRYLVVFEWLSRRRGLPWRARVDNSGVTRPRRILGFRSRSKRKTSAPTNGLHSAAIVGTAFGSRRVGTEKSRYRWFAADWIQWMRLAQPTGAPPTVTISFDTSACACCEKTNIGRYTRRASITTNTLGSTLPSIAPTERVTGGVMHQVKMPAKSDPCIT